MRKSINIIRSVVYISVKGIFGVLTKLLFATKVEGRENLPKEGPFIIAANHTSFADVPVIAVNMPVMIRWITLEGVYNVWYLRAFHKIFGSIITNGSVEKALRALEQKDVIGIFPEGTRSDDGRLKRSDIGVAIMALRSGVSVVPVGVSGTFKAFPQQARFPRFHPVLVKIGRPLIFRKSGKDIIEEDVLREATDRIMAKISELLVDI